MSFEERLAEAVGPEPDYSKIPEELWKTYKGARVIYEVHVSQILYPMASYEKLLIEPSSVSERLSRQRPTSDSKT